MAVPPLPIGPVPAYNNPPINPQFYKPQRFQILDIDLGQTTLVTTIVDHDYVISQQCRLLIPMESGCRQLNQVTGFVLSIPDDDQVELSIDSSQNVDQFTPSLEPTQPQIVAIGDINSGPTNTGRTNNQTYISGSFINISPL